MYIFVLYADNFQCLIENCICTFEFTTVVHIHKNLDCVQSG